MNKIKTLTVNGEPYQLWDGEAAHIDDSKIGPDAWSGKNTVDKLCPGFTESGAMVAFHPVAGYPLTVQAEESATAITRTGKNLLPDGWKDWSNYVKIGYYEKPNVFPFELPPGKYCISGEFNISSTQDVYVYLVKSIDGGQTYSEENLRADGIYGYISAGTTEKNRIIFNVTDDPNAKWGIFSRIQDILNIKYLQIEKGEVATEYEPYRGDTFAPGETIPALEGVNTLWADSGEITVTGKADPTAVMKKLTNAIIALGGNI